MSTPSETGYNGLRAPEVITGPRISAITPPVPGVPSINPSVPNPAGTMTVLQMPNVIAKGSMPMVFDDSTVNGARPTLSDEQ
jgi:hypothetical protein